MYTLPLTYKSILNNKETEHAIVAIKDFFQMALSPGSLSRPVFVVQVNLVHLHQIFRQLVFELSPHGSVRHYGQHYKFMLRKGCYHAVYPAGHTAHHIGIASFRYHTYPHFTVLPAG